MNAAATTLMGPNGSGNSTLAYAIMGHPAYEITEGEIHLDGRHRRDGADEGRSGALPRFSTHRIRASRASSSVGAQRVRKARAGEDDPVSVKDSAPSCFSEEHLRCRGARHALSQRGFRRREEAARVCRWRLKPRIAVPTRPTRASNRCAEDRGTGGQGARRALLGA